MFFYNLNIPSIEMSSPKVAIKEEREEKGKLREKKKEGEEKERREKREAKRKHFGWNVLTFSLVC